MTLLGFAGIIIAGITVIALLSVLFAWMTDPKWKRIDGIKNHKLN